MRLPWCRHEWVEWDDFTHYPDYLELPVIVRAFKCAKCGSVDRGVNRGQKY